MSCPRIIVRVAGCVMLASCLAQAGQSKKSEPAASSDYVVVTALTGYLLTDRGNVLEELPTWTHLRIEKSEPTRLRVTTPVGQVGWIRRELVQPNPLENPSEEDLIAAEKVALLLAKSNKQFDNGDTPAGVRSTKEALRIVEAAIGRYNLLCPWVLSHVAYGQYLSDDLDGAKASLARADAILKKLKTGGSVQADVENIRAIVLATAGDMRAAFAAYAKAIAAAKRFGGDQHSDVRVIMMNLASSHARAGNFKEAARIQEKVCDIGAAILPPDVIEHASAKSMFGWYLSSSGQTVEAVPHLQESLRRYRRLKGEKDAGTVEVRDLLAEIPAVFREEIRGKRASFSPDQGMLRVIANHAYIRDESGAILRTLSRHTPVTFVRAQGDLYEVKFRKTQGWTKKAQLVADPTYALNEHTPENREKMLEARLLHQEAMELLESDLDIDPAVARMNRAREIVAGVGDKATLSTIVKELGYLVSSQGNFSQAKKHLRLATKLLGESKHAGSPVLNAELENAKGHVAVAAGEFQAAVTHYSKALDVMRGEFGEKNAGTASMYGNMSVAHSYSGDVQMAKKFVEKHVATMYAAYEADTNEMSFAYDHYAGVLSRLGEHAVARGYAERALEIRQQLFGPDHPQTANLHMSLGEVLALGGDTPGAEKQLLKALEICDRLDSPKTRSLRTRTRSSLVFILRNANQPIQALSHTGPLLELLKTPGSGSKGQLSADVVDQIAKFEQIAKELTVEARRSQADANQMLVVLRDGRIKDGSRVMMTVPIGTRLWSLKLQDGWHKVMVGEKGRKRPGWINAKTVTSVESQLFAELDQAGDMLEKQNMLLKLQQTVAANPDLFEKQDLTREETIKALRIIDQLAVDVEGISGDNFVSATINQLLAGLYLEFGEFGEARKHLEAALATHIEHLGREHPQTAQDRLQLGNLLASIGDHVGAEREFRTVVGVMEDAFGSNNPSALDARATLGSHLVDMGAIDEGRAMLTQVLETEEKAGRGDQLTVLRPLSALSVLAARENKPDLALTQIKRARQVFAAFKDQVADVDLDIVLQLQLGVTQLRSGDGPIGLYNLNASFERATKELGSAHSLTSNAASSLGYGISLYGRDMKKATRLASQGLSTVVKTAGPDHVGTVSPLVHLAAVNYRQGNLRQALSLLERARTTTNKYVREVLVEMPAQAQVRFLERNDRRIRDASLSLAFKHGDKQKVIDRTARWVLNSKGLAVETAAARGTLQNFLSSESSRTQFKQWQDLRRQISTFPLEGANDRVREARRAELQTLRSQEQELRNKISPGFAKEVARQQQGMVDVDSVRSKIPGDSVLIELLRVQPIELDRIISPDARKPERYVAWIVRPLKGEDITFVDLGEAARIDRLVAAAQTSILESPKLIEENGSIEATKSVRAALEPLHSQLWQPLQRAIGDGQKKIILSPDANLWLIPWAAIPISDEKFLVEEFEIRLVNSGRDLTNPANNQNLGRPVIIADPAFNSGVQEIEDTIRILELDTKRTRSISFDGSALGKVRQLPGTRKEAEIIETSLEVSNNVGPEIFLGQQAAEAVFKSLERPRTLMMGTHGFVLDETQSKDPNPLARCGLLLAGYNDALDDQAASGDDGVLTGLEIVETDLRGTELVVLSACQTGLGAIQDGEGVAGLRQAFQLAGAESVVATLWEISDIATVNLMVTLFDGLALKKSKPAALRDAQIKQIRQLRDREGAAHPFFWAAFTVTGHE